MSDRGTGATQQRGNDFAHDDAPQRRAGVPWVLERVSEPSVTVEYTQGAWRVLRTPPLAEPSGGAG